MKDRNIWVNSFYGLFFAGGYFVVVYYLPIYFQSIDNVNPTISGVHNLPFIISVVLGIILTSGSISKNGLLAHPYLVVGATIATIGTGLLHTLNIGSSTGKWIGFQILAGFGYGAYQVPLIAAQGTIDQRDLASGTGMVLCQYCLISYSRIENLTNHSFPNSWICFWHIYCTSRLRKP